MATTRRERFLPNGLLALDHRAFAQLFEFAEGLPVAEPCAGVAVVDIRGPLMHHREWCFDSYESIVDRVRDEWARDNTTAVVLRVDSPGGLCSGVFEAAGKLRAMADAAGKPFYAYVDGAACSAAYALAVAADKIYVAASANVGSIGVIEVAVDASRQDAALGLSFAIIASGERKADGNPHQRLSDESRAAMQTRVDALAEQFFEHVASRRPGTTADGIRAMQAGIYLGAQAVSPDLRLADQVAVWDQVLAALAATPTGSASAMADDDDKKKDDKGEEKDAALAALVAGCESEDPEKKAKAQRALAAYLADAEPEDDKKGDDKKNADAKASARAFAAATALAVKASTDLAAYKLEQANAAKASAAQADANEIATLLASRPDFAEEFRKTLASSPIDTVRALVKNAPVMAHGAPVGAGAGKPSGSAGVSEYAAELDAKMGLAPVQTEASWNGHGQFQIPTLTRAQALANIASASKGVGK